MWPTLMQWDISLLYQINGAWIHPVLDKVMAVASDFNLFKIPLLLGIFAILIWGGFRGRLFLFIMLWCVVIGDMGIDYGLKKWVHRPRPYETLQNIRQVDLREIKMSQPTITPGGHSFPSGHAFNNVSLALVATLLYGRWALLLWPWAMLVSYSRVYTGSHYPSDVLLSWPISLAYTWVILKVINWLWEKWGARVMPKLYAAHPQFIFKSKAS